MPNPPPDARDEVFASPEHQTRQVEWREIFRSKFKAHFDSVCELANKVAKKDSLIKQLSEEELMDRFAGLVLPRLVFAKSSFGAYLSSMRTRIRDDLPAIETYEDLVQVGAQAINNAEVSFRQFFNIVTLLPPREYEIFLEILMTVSSVKNPKSEMSAVSVGSRLTKDEAAASIKQAVKLLTDCRAAFVASTGTRTDKNGRPPSPYTLIVADVAELWESLTGKRAVYPHLPKPDKIAVDQGQVRKKDRTESNEASVQFILEVMRMIDPNIKLQQAETATRHVLDIRGAFPVWGSSFRMFHYLNRNVSLIDLDPPAAVGTDLTVAIVPRRNPNRRRKKSTPKIAKF